MPNIHEANTPALGLNPTEVGVEATAGAARRIGAFYNQAGDALTSTGQRVGAAIRDAGDVVVKHIDHQQISAGAATGAQMFDGLIESKDKLIKGIDPNDPLYGQKVEGALKQWREETMEPALQKFGDGFSTEKSQAWSEHFIDQTRQHMFHQTAADTSTAAGIGVQNSIRTFANVASNTALRDPSAVPAQLDLAEHSIGGLVQSSPLKGVNAAKIQTEVLEKTREQIVKAGALGAIQKSDNPEATAQDWIGKYPKYINGQEAQFLAQNARQQLRAREADTERARRLAKEDAADRSSAKVGEYQSAIMSSDPRVKNNPLAQKAANDPDLLPAARANIYNLIRRESLPETDTRISNDTMIDFMKELRPGNRKELDAETFEQRLWDARVKNPGEPGSLTETHFNQLRRELLDRKTPEGLALSEDRNRFLSDFGAAIDGGMTGNVHSALGKQKMAEAREEMLAREEQLKKEGKNPRELYRRGSESYFDKEGAGSKKYGVGLQSVLNYWASIGAGSEAAKAKGLSKENPVEIPAGMTLQKAREQGIPSGTFIKLPSGDIKVMP